MDVESPPPPGNEMSADIMAAWKRRKFEDAAISDVSFVPFIVEATGASAGEDPATWTLFKMGIVNRMLEKI